MGCWNGTCGVSHLPIRYGDPVRVFLIVGAHSHLDKAFREEDWDPNDEDDDDWREGWWGGFCHSSDIFCPMGAPFKATYNDYGSVENIQDCFNKDIVTTTLKSRLIEFTKGLHSLPDAVNNSLSLDTLVQLVERNAVTILDSQNRSVPVGLFMVHEHVYQALVNLKNKDWREEIVDLDLFRAMATKWADSTSSYVRLMNSPMPEDRLKTIFSGLNVDLAGFWPSNAFATTYLLRYKERLVEMFKVNDDKFFESKKFQELIEEMAEFSKFCYEMEMARIAFMPQCGAGSQNAETHVHKAIAESVLQFHANLQKEMEEDND